MKKIPGIFNCCIFVMSLILTVLFFNGCGFDKADQQITATGTIEMTETMVSSKAVGKVMKATTVEGQAVKTGDLLVELDHQELDAQIAAAKSNLEVAKANYSSAATDLQRNTQLYQGQLISKSQYDQFVTKADVTKAQVKQADSNIDLLRAQLDNVKIFAPVNGIVSAKLIETGELVSMGTSVATILDYQKPWVKIYLPLKEVEQVSLNQKAYAKLDAFPNKKFYGRISFISQEAEFTPKDYLSKEERVKQVFAVKIELDNKEKLLKAGLPVDVWVE